MALRVAKKRTTLRRTIAVEEAIKEVIAEPIAEAIEAAPIETVPIVRLEVAAIIIMSIIPLEVEERSTTLMTTIVVAEAITKPIETIHQKKNAIAVLATTK